MPIDPSKLELPKRRGNRTVARCPACAETGADKSAEHLIVFADGKFGCVAFAGDKPHRSRILELIGDGQPDQAAVISPRPSPPRGNPDLSKIETPSIADLHHIAVTRGLPLFAGLQVAANAGHLFSAMLPDGEETVRCWVITDSARRNAQARRMDGRLWSKIAAKAKTLRSSEAGWPIGAADIGDKPTVALCEGGPDFLSAYFIAWRHGKHREVAPVAMLGAGQRIHPDALPNFAGKHIVIFPHQDAAGEKARAVWTKQLRDAGSATIQPFDTAPHKDLNDLVRACASKLEEGEVE